MAGTFVYTPAAGTILHGGNQTLSVTFTPTDTTDYSPITTMAILCQSGHTGDYLEHSRPHYLRHAPEQHATGCHRCRSEYRISSERHLCLHARDRHDSRPRQHILNVTFTPTDTTDYTTAEASVTLAVTPSDHATPGVVQRHQHGADPHAGLIMDSSGNLYGTTELGGADGNGTVFELAKGSGTITTLASFNGTNGDYPHAGADHGQQRQSVRHDRGWRRQSSDGTVFELAKGSGTITTLASFNGTNGANPIGRADHGQQRQSVRHNAMGRRQRRRHGFRAGQGQRHDHHPGFVQRHQRSSPRLAA